LTHFASNLKPRFQRFC